MLLNIILIVVIGISLLVILFILLKKVPKLKVLDVNTLPEEQTAQVRNRILVDRMKRKTDKGKDVVKSITIPFITAIKNIFKNVFRKVHELEKKYQKEAKSTGVDAHDVNARINSLFAEVTRLVKDEKFKEAEKKYIEIITLDPKNIKAYEGLGEVYIELKEFKQALETYIFVLKLEEKNSKQIEKKNEQGQTIIVVSNAHELADVHIDLGEVYQMMEKYKEALNHYKKALNLEPNNPKNLDQMIEISILVKDKELGQEMIDRLEKVNPENQKLYEYREKLKDL